MTNNKKLEKIKIFPFAVDMPSCLKVCAHCNDCLKQYVWEPHKLNVVMYYRNEKDEYVEWKPKEVLNSLLQEIEDEVEEAYKEGIVTFENNHRGKPMEKDMAEGFAKGAWTGFKAAYLDKALKTIKERYLDGNESKGGVNNG